MRVPTTSVPAASVPAPQPPMRDIAARAIAPRPPANANNTNSFLRLRGNERPDGHSHLERAFVRVLYTPGRNLGEPMEVVLEFAEGHAIVIGCRGDGTLRMRSISIDDARGAPHGDIDVVEMPMIAGALLEHLTVTSDEVTLEFPQAMLTVLNRDNHLLVAINGTPVI